MTSRVSAESVRAQLSALAKSKGEDTQLLLLRYANERVLYRLSCSRYANRFVLKGAMLFTYWTREAHRATRDLDLLGIDPPNQDGLRLIFQQVLAPEAADDALVFDLASMTVTPIRAQQSYGGLRVTARCTLGRARIPLQIDVGFGDAVQSEREELETLLGLPHPVLQVYPRVCVVAEKTEAMVQLGVFNSRMKDFYDIAVLAEDFAFEGAALVAAFHATFTQRQTTLPRAGLAPLFRSLLEASDKSVQWAGFVRKAKARRLWAFPEALERVLQFADAPLRAAAGAEAFAKHWSPNGPWS